MSINLDTFDVNCSLDDGDYTVTVDTRSFLRLMKGAHFVNRTERQLSTFDTLNDTSPFAGMPAHLTLDSPKSEILRAVKKLRPYEESVWWNEMFNPENVYIKSRIKAYNILSRNSTTQSSIDREGRKRPFAIPGPQVKPSANTRQKVVKTKNPPLSGRNRTDAQAGELEDGEIVDGDGAANAANPDVDTEDIPTAELEDWAAQAVRDKKNNGRVLDGVGDQLGKPEDKKPRVYSQLRMDIKDTRTLLNRADCLLWETSARNLTCDGKTPVGSTGFCLPKLRAKAFEELLLKGHGPEAVSAKLGFGTHANSFKHPHATLIAVPEQPMTIRDDDLYPLVFYIPNFFSDGQTERCSENLLAFSEFAKLKLKQADCTGRGDPKSYVIRDGHPHGCANIVSTWVPLGGEKSDPVPSATLINGLKGGVVEAFVGMQEHLDDVRTPGVLMSYALRMLDHRSYWQHYCLKQRIQEMNPGARPFAPNDPTIANGHSYIFNRRTKIHCDTKEHYAAWSPLQVMGTCKTGYLALPQLGIKLPYLPGTLVFIRGQFLAHGVVDWEGDGDRICIAHFNHASEWEYAGLRPELYKP